MSGISSTRLAKKKQNTELLQEMRLRRRQQQQKEMRLWRRQQQQKQIIVESAVENNKITPGATAAAARNEAAAATTANSIRNNYGTVRLVVPTVKRNKRSSNKFYTGSTGSFFKKVLYVMIRSSKLEALENELWCIRRPSKLT